MTGNMNIFPQLIKDYFIAGTCERETISQMLSI